MREVIKKYTIVGAVVHDDGAVFDSALRGTRFVAQVENAGHRFPTQVVVDGGACVLLVGTGMGSVGQSIVAYELAMQVPNPRILKIGTCVSTWLRTKVGTILVPIKAVADDGVASWDIRWRDGQFEVSDVLRGRIVVEPDRGLTDDWLKQLQRHSDWPLDDDTAGEAVIWSADAFYPLSLRPDYLHLLALRHSIEVERRGSGNIVARCPRWQPGKPRIMGWDMECSALFAAGKVVGARVAAGLVVSYTTDEHCTIGEEGLKTRPDSEGERAHSIEHALIVEAIEHLLDGR